uniref:ESF1-like protein n=1 Tax=Timema genevievae TaxID=629358 RepID=A0A7R9JRC7_TIMGE|nr:unnamed protein product [Timema genevievae]
MDDILKDDRFSHIFHDPRFKRIPKLERKVKIDKRFQSMFKDKKFQVKYTVDKRGRPVDHTTNEDLRKYYDISSNDESDIEEDKEQKKEKVNRSAKVTPKPDEKLTSKQSKERNKLRLPKNTSILHKSSIRDNSPADGINDVNIINSNKLETQLKIKAKTKGTKIRRPALENIHDDENEVNSLKKNISHESQSDDSDEDDNTVNSEESSDGYASLGAEDELAVTGDTKIRLRDLNIDYARGEGVLITSSSSSEDEDSDSESVDELEHGWGELDHDAEPTDEITNRLAVCNMDWDNIRVSDLMVLFNSFLPANGIIKSVTIYPSEIGMKKMEEEVNFPPELRSLSDNKTLKTLDDHLNDDRNEEENEEGNEYHMEKLRQYQLNKLKYYYAVVVCDSPATANKIYTECDGLEYESSSSKLDLRFIPDETTFDQEPHEVCESLPDMSKYQPRFFNTTALQQSKVDLTWDDDNPERVEITQKAMSGEVEDLDLRTLLADYSSEEDPENEQAGSNSEVKEMKDQEGKNGEDSISKYRALLLDFEEEEQRKKSGEVEMEVSWGLGLKEKAKELVKKKMKEGQDLTPFQEYLDKRQDKRRQKKLDRKKKLQEASFILGILVVMLLFARNQVDVKDDRFEALFSSHHYNIDPADPHYRKTKAMEALKLEKLKRRQQEDSNHFKMQKSTTQNNQTDIDLEGGDTTY